MEHIKEISKLKDKELLETFGVLVKKEKEATACVVAHLAEIDRRKLYALEGYSSLFSYCCEKYHYSESAAYRRIQACRIYPKFPEILNLLKEGKLNLVTLALIEPHLDQKNGGSLIGKILGKSKREVEEVLSELSLKKEKIQDIIRRLPLKKAVLAKTAQNFTSAGGSENDQKDVSQKEQEISLKISPVLSDTAKTEVQEIRKVKIEFVADEKVAKLIERAKELLRHKYPQGKLEDLVREAFELLLEKKDPERKIRRMEQKTSHCEQNEVERRISTGSLGLRPRDDAAAQNGAQSKTRYIPQVLQREVYKRDKGKCSYVSSDGKPCGERNFLELDHVKPWALGGDHTFKNLQILCCTHNQFRAEKTFGE